MNHGALIVDGLEGRGLKLVADGDQIVASGGSLAEHDRAQLLAHKAEVLGHLRERAGLCPTCGRGDKPQTRPPAVQVRDVKAIKDGQSEYHQWDEAAYQRLEKVMLPGDEIVQVYALSVVVRAADGRRYEVGRDGQRRDR